MNFKQQDEFLNTTQVLMLTLGSVFSVPQHHQKWLICFSFSQMECQTRLNTAHGPRVNLIINCFEYQHGNYSSEESRPLIHTTWATIA